MSYKQKLPVMGSAFPIQELNSTEGFVFLFLGSLVCCCLSCCYSLNLVWWKLKCCWWVTNWQF